MELFLLYLILQLNSFHTVLAVVATLCGMLAAITALFGVIIRDDSRDPNDKQMGQDLLNKAPKLATICFISATTAVLLPSKSDAFLLVGAWAGLEAMKSEEVRQFSGKLYDYVDNELDRLIDEQEN